MTDEAEEIRQYFESRKKESPESTKKTYSTYGRFEESFEKAAELCNIHKATPIDWVNAHFLGSHADTIQPQFLAGSNSVKKYNEYMTQFKVTYSELFDLFIMKLRRQIELGREVEWVLNCKDFDFPAWFRICITKEPVQLIIDNYNKAAKEEYTAELRDFLISKKLDYRRIIK